MINEICVDRFIETEDTDYLDMCSELSYELIRKCYHVIKTPYIDKYFYTLRFENKLNSNIRRLEEVLKHISWFEKNLKGSKLHYYFFLKCNFIKPEPNNSLYAEFMFNRDCHLNIIFKIPGIIKHLSDEYLDLVISNNKVIKFNDYVIKDLCDRGKTLMLMKSGYLQDLRQDMDKKLNSDCVDLILEKIEMQI
jgi:hypothetical protein